MKAYKLNDTVQLQRTLSQHAQLFTARGNDENATWQHVAPEDVTPTQPPRGPGRTSAKAFFFPELESLFRFDGKQFKETVPEIPHTVLFGVTACNLAAISYQDHFFAEDPYYQARRSKTLLVGVDCLEQCPGGFCPTTDSGPFVRPNHTDLVLHKQADDNYLLIAMSEAGNIACDELELPEADTGWQDERAAKEKQVVAGFSIPSAMEQGKQAINQQQVDHEQWQKIGMQCVTCSGCTNICPTCTCYTTFDTTLDDGAIERKRCWDSCLFEGFQKEASGHNPSHAIEERIARFWYHKFSETFTEQCGRIGCVGCGRCDQVCPGVIGAHSVMEKIAQ